MEPTINWVSLLFAQFLAFVPSLIAGLVILLLGFLVALVLARATRALASRLGFDRFVARLGLGEPTGTKTPSYVLGSALFFVIMVATVMQTARLWNLTFVAAGLARFIAYLPHLFAAAVVFAVSLFLGNWVGNRLTRRSTIASEPSQQRFLAAATRIAILALGSFMALRELQIAPEIVNSAFVLILAAAALAGALAFGLGGRDVARQMTQSWYERRRYRGGMVGTPGIDTTTTPVEPQPL